MTTAARKTYSYGGPKLKKNTELWDNAKKNSPGKGATFSPKKGIWTKVSVSPFKSNLERKEPKPLYDSDDPFGFPVSNCDEFNNLPEITDQRKDMKELTKGVKGSPLRAKKLKSPLKGKRKKLATPPQSPTEKSRIYGKALVANGVALTVNDLKASPKKTSKNTASQKSTANVNGKKDSKKTGTNKKTQNGSHRVSESENLINQADDAMNDAFEITFVDDRDIPNFVTKDNEEKQKTPSKSVNKKGKGRRVASRSSKSRRNVKKAEEVAVQLNDVTEVSEVNDQIVEVDKDTQNTQKLKAGTLFTYYDKQKNKSNPEVTGTIYGPKKVNIETEDSDVEMQESMGSEPTNNNDLQSPVKVVKRGLFDKDHQSSKRQKIDEDASGSQSNAISEEAISNSIETESSQEKSIKVKSPFKSLKARSSRSIKKRRFSGLPTNVSSNDLSGDEKDENAHEELEDSEPDDAYPIHSPPALYTSALFGFSRVDTAVRVKKTEKELFTVVKNTKHAYQCLEHGESQQFKDDLEYLLDGLKPTHTVSTRSLSALELALKCTSPTFRMHVKAHGVIENIFSSLQDALEDERLALSTSTIMFVLAKDRLKINFNKKIVEFMLKLLCRKDRKLDKNNEYEKLLKKVKVILEKQELPNIYLDEIDAVLLARETLLSFTSQRIGEWFKEEIRSLGGLDHLVDTIYTCSKGILKVEDVDKSSRVMERCMLLLCDMTFRSSKNQSYLDSYENGLLLDSCVRTLHFITSKMDMSKDFIPGIQECLFALLRLLTNLSHENVTGCLKICKRDGSLTSILKCALFIPQFLPPDKMFDCMIMSIGLLINLIEHSKANATILNLSVAPAFYESQSSSENSQGHSQTSCSAPETEQLSPVEALMQLFLIRFESSKEHDLMEELDKLENDQEERDAALHYEDDEYALTCGDKFDDTVEEETKSTVKTTTATKDCSITEVCSTTEKSTTLNQKEKQDIKETLKKAHRHMEDSHIAAFTSLLIGLLIEENEDNQETAHSLLPNGDFKPMRESLEKILAFMKITAATSESGFKVIARIIDVYKLYETRYGKACVVEEEDVEKKLPEKGNEGKLPGDEVVEHPPADVDP